MRTKDELFRAAQREIAAQRQHAVMQAETARRAAYAANPALSAADDAKMRAGLSLARTAALGGDMDAARALRGQVFYFDRNDATLPAGRWYVADLIGCEVRDADTGKVYGVVTSVDHPGAQDIYTVKAPNGKEYMFPGVDAFLKERNPPEGYLLVTPIPGLLDDDFDSEREEE